MPVPTADNLMTRVPARDFYDRISGFYDVLASLGERRLIGAGLHKLAVKRGESILDIGFGSGQALLMLADAVGDAGLICGLDISEGMNRVASRKIRGAGLENRITLSLGDAVRLPYQDACFDAVFTSFTLELFDTSQIPLVLAECRRILKNPGRMCVVALSRDGELGRVGRLYERLHIRFPQYLDCRPIPLISILNREGFRVLDIEQYSLWGLPVGIALAEKCLVKLIAPALEKYELNRR